MPATRRVLTGITTTGSPHLGNYVGAIRPAIAASRRAEVESFYFLADYHALVKCQEPERVQQSTLEIAASWLACGLDPEKVFFYRQSDIPEIPELTWLLTCVTAKGLLNRAHAYKAATDANKEAGEDADAGINAGLYLYPVLMAADILLFNAHEVPVGRDQVQHIEMARDIAQRFNHLFGTGRELFALPEARIEDNVATLPGLDGRKMSKSYNNSIPLWLPAPALRRAILGIVTNSIEPGQPKDPESSNIFAIYQAFATAEESAAMRAAFAAGIGWGEAKQRLFERIEAELGPLRARYDALIAQPAEIEAALQAGARKAHARAASLLEELRNAVGLRSLANCQAGRPETGTASEPLAEPARFKQFREADGRFRFRIDYGSENSLLSRSFADGRDAGAALRRLREQPGEYVELSVREREDGGYELDLMQDEHLLAKGAAFADRAACERELELVRAALTVAQRQESAKAT
jgi:tryptophanyl-tRNA synthetase